MSEPDTAISVSEDDPVLRLRLDIAYDGTGFSGWAYQPNRRTVAGEILAALTLVLPGHRGLTVAGRTDAGVHATGQVAHVDVPAHAWTLGSGKALRRINGILAADVRVRSIQPVAETFNARFAALSRRYVYRIGDDQWGVCPLERHNTLAWPRTLNEAVMREAANVLLGEHDFAAFCKRRDGATTIRALERLDVFRRADQVIEVVVVADAFCHSMVRSLVGALIAVGEGRRKADWLCGLLTLGHRSSEIVVAPAHGLTLVEVRFPEDSVQWAKRSSETRQRRTLPSTS